MTKHTPGPWHINTAGSSSRGEPFKITEIYVYAPDTQDDTAICADVIDPVTQEPSEANARLIAAAPDLLAALVNLLNDTQHAEHPDCDDGPCPVREARAAIQKATGGTHKEGA